MPVSYRPCQTALTREQRGRKGEAGEVWLNQLCFEKAMSKRLVALTGSTDEEKKVSEIRVQQRVSLPITWGRVYFQRVPLRHTVPEIRVPPPGRWPRPSSHFRVGANFEGGKFAFPDDRLFIKSTRGKRTKSQVCIARQRPNSNLPFEQQSS